MKNTIILLLIIFSQKAFSADEITTKYFIKFNIHTEEKDIAVNEEITDPAVVKFISNIKNYKEFDMTAEIKSGKGAVLLPPIVMSHYICDAQGKTVYSITDNYKLIIPESGSVKYYIFEQNDSVKIQRLIARIERKIKYPDKAPK